MYFQVFAGGEEPTQRYPKVRTGYVTLYCSVPGAVVHVDFLLVQQSLLLANFPDSMCETIPVRPQAVLDQPGAGDVVRAGQKGIWQAQLCTGQCLRDERGFTCIPFFGLLFDTCRTGSLSQHS